VIPLRRLLSLRRITSYAARWRELLLYARLGLGALHGRDLRGQEEQLLRRHGSAAANK
jgi:hypothetical protein